MRVKEGVFHWVKLGYCFYMEVKDAKQSYHIVGNHVLIHEPESFKCGLSFGFIKPSSESAEKTEQNIYFH